MKPTPPEASTGFCFCVVSLRHKEREALRHQASGWITQLAHSLAPAPTPHCVYLEPLVTRQGEASAEEEGTLKAQDSECKPGHCPPYPDSIVRHSTPCPKWELALKMRPALCPLGWAGGSNRGHSERVQAKNPNSPKAHLKLHKIASIIQRNPLKRRPLRFSGTTATSSLALVLPQV